jgi:type IV secretion system protein VirB10
LILPDGTSLDLGGLKASDRAGYAGVEDDVEYHGFEMVKGIALASLLGVGSELTFGNDESDTLAALRRLLQESTSDAGDRVVDRALGMKPTLTVRPGWPLTVIVTENLTIKPFNGDRS